MESLTPESPRRGPAEQIRPLIEALQQHMDAQFATMQRVHDAGSAKGQRSMQELQRGIEQGLAQVEGHTRAIHQAIAQLGQRATVVRSVVAALGGALAGTLVLVALWLALGQIMHVRMMPAPAAQGPSHGQPKGR